MKAENIIKTRTGRRYLRKVANASPYCRFYVMEGDTPPELSTIKKARIDPRRKKNNGVVVRTLTVVKVGIDWNSDKNPFDPKRHVPYLKASLNSIGYNVNTYPKTRQYRIFSDALNFDSGLISLVEFRKTANRLRKLNRLSRLQF